MLSISSIPEKLCLAENFIQKSDDSINNVASLTVNSVMDMFLQVLAKFSEQSCLENHLQEQTCSMSKSEHMLLT